MRVSLGRLAGLSALVLVFALALSARADADLWGHVRFGLDTIQARHLSTVDPYSFTQDIPWINHEWLSEVLLAGVYQMAGPEGLQVEKAALVTVVVVLVWGALTRVRLAGRVAVMVVLTIGTIHMWATIRPQLWSLLFLTSLCRVLTTRSGRLVWWLPPMFAVWANCHGGWIVGLGVMGAWVAAGVFEDAPRRWVEVRVFLACLLATLCNPYGWRLWAFMWRTVHMTRSIEEWQPLWQAPVLNWMPWVLASALVILVIRQRQARSLSTALSVGALGFLALRVQRIESLFVVAAAILAGPWLSRQWPAVENSRPMRLTGLVAAPVFLSAVTLAWCIGSWAVRCVPIFGDWAPDTVSALMLESAPAGRLVTYFDWGEYAIWHFAPRLRVSIDGRRETVYSDARLAEGDAIVAGRPEGLETLRLWSPEYVWLPSRSVTTRRWLEGHGYRIDASTSLSFIAVRGDLTPLHAERALSGDHCFPGA